MFRNPRHPLSPANLVAGIFIAVAGTIIAALLLRQLDSPTPTPTVTITATPMQPTARPTPNSDVLLDEDFQDGVTDDFSFTIGNWQVIDDGTGNKVLEANNPGYSLSTWPRADFGPTTLRDYSIEYRLRLIEYDLSQETSSGSTFLLFRQSAPSTYVFILPPYGHLIELDYSSPDGSWHNLAGGEGVQVNDFQKNVWYSVRIEAYGTQINAYLDGNLLFAVKDSRSKEGNLAFLTGPNTTAQFDDVRVMK